ncbi:winged helix DNA-binding domain-containing protein [Leucobacter massiliensis]|uniref:Winged helix DNA-binding domain-containing protein n=1 Tax=Leucobacter massiliensis TaxID=1686285 RepID=A0A2S9QK84_9MICO|nr:winged helix DNA-binding domain-containing protein [Leucobacter massiliensis]PRI09995.1 hypothetical protein B4915_13795 [Leucobacter massiliensis]
MTETITDDDVLLLRMRSLGLAGAASSGSGPAGTGTDASGAGRIAAIARHLLALQGQDWRSSRWALGVRAERVAGAPAELADVATALNSGAVVRSWPVRGTIHLLAAEDLGWMQAAAGARPLAGAAKRRAFLGIGDRTLDRLVEVSLAALRAGGERGLERDDLARAWSEAGIEWQSNWRYHLIWWLHQNGLAVFGPTDGEAEPRLVLAEGWIREPRTPADPLAELAARYTAARGPVRTKDLAWWAGISAGEAKRGFEAAAEQGAVVRAQLAGVAGAAGTLWVSPGTLGSTAIVPEWLLLPAFDEHLLGYTVRDAQLDPAHFERIVPGRNGMFLATVVHRGRVAGTWRRRTRAGGGIEATPLPGSRLDAAALADEHARWAAFHGLVPGPVELAAPAA